MADGVDGEIKLSVKLTPTDIKKTTTQLQQEISKVFSDTGGKQVSKQLGNLEIQMDKLTSKSVKLQESLEQMENTKIPTEEYKEITKQIADAEKKLNALNAAEERAAETGKPFKGQRLRAMQYAVSELENTITYAKEELKELEEAGQDFTLGSDTQAYTDKLAQLNTVNNQMTQLIAAAEELKQEEEELPQPVAETSRWAERLQSVLGFVKRIFTGILGISIQLLGKIKSMVIYVGSKLVSGVKKLLSQIKKIGHHTNKHEISLKKMSRLILKYGLGVRSVFVLWRKLRSYATEAIKAMTKSFEGVDSDVSRLYNSFNQFKNSIGTFVQPLLHALAPALETVLGLLTRVSEKVASFIATLTGQKYIYKATKSNKSYAESLEGVSKSAKEATKALASYDKLNVISKNAAGGSDTSDTSSSGVFEQVAADSSLANKLKDIISTDDWESVGKLFAEKLNTLTYALENWLTVTFNPQAKLWAERFAKILNGFIGNTDWSALGTTVGTGLNGILTAANRFLTEFNALGLGQGLGNFVQNLIDTTNWSEAASVLTGHFNNLFSVLQGFSDNFDGKSLGTALSTFINEGVKNFDWAAAGKALSDFVKDFLDAIATVLEETDWAALGDSIVTGIKSVDWKGVVSRVFTVIGGAFGALASLFATIGGNIVEGLEGGILNALKSIGKWIHDNIFIPFLEGFCKAFGIESPSKEMKTMGVYIIQGLIDGIKSMFLKLWGLVTLIKDTVVGIFEKGGELVKGIWHGISSTIGKVVFGIWTKVTAGFSLVRSTVITIFEGIYDKVKEIWGNIKDFITGTIDDISTVVDNWGEIWGYAKGDLKKFFGIGGAGKSSGGGGGSFGVDHLASGAVIPPNREFLAVLGDQKSGTNVEAPLATIQEALANVLAKWDNNRGNQDITLNLDGKTVARVVWDETQKKYKQTGVRYA